MGKRHTTGRLTRRTFIGRSLAVGAAVSLGAGVGEARAGGTYRRLYCAINGSMTIYDVPSWQVVRTVQIPSIADGPRGIVCHPGIGSLWITHGMDDGTGGSLLRYNLVEDRVQWDRPLGFGVDQPAISLNGARLYVPTGEKSSNRLWYVLHPLSATVMKTMSGAAGPHNTIARTNHVYLAGVQSPHVYLQGGRQIGPLVNGCRPFTVDAAEHLIYTTSTHVRGFQVSSIGTGKVLATINFGPTPRHFTPSAPSHGISLSPDGREVWVLDMPAQCVRIFSAGESPQHLADVAINPITGRDLPPTGFDNIKAGWVLHSKWGDYVYVADSGSVISTATRRQVTVLPALANGRHGVVEVMFDSTGVPVDTSTHFGMGY
ncbi:MAG: YncE family protein [Gaiellales bacterium]